MKPAIWIPLGAFVVLVLSFVLTPQTLPEVSTCVFYDWTGVPCAGCGMTRAFCSLGHADWLAAWNYHPLSFPLYAVFVVAALWPLLSRVVPGIGVLVRPSVLLVGGIAFALALAAFGFWRAWDLIAARF